LEGCCCCCCCESRWKTKSRSGFLFVVAGGVGGNNLCLCVFLVVPAVAVIEEPPSFPNGSSSICGFERGEEKRCRFPQQGFLLRRCLFLGRCRCLSIDARLTTAHCVSWIANCTVGVSASSRRHGTIRTEPALHGKARQLSIDRSSFQTNYYCCCSRDIAVRGCRGYAFCSLVRGPYCCCKRARKPEQKKRVVLCWIAPTNESMPTTVAIDD